MLDLVEHNSQRTYIGRAGSMHRPDVQAWAAQSSLVATEVRNQC